MLFWKYTFSKEQRFNSGGSLLLKGNILLSESSEAATHSCSKSFKGAYIKHVGGGIGGFYKFFKKFFVGQETLDVSISRPSHFLMKYFMAPPINFSFLFKAYL